MKKGWLSTEHKLFILFHFSCSHLWGKNNVTPLWSGTKRCFKTFTETSKQNTQSFL